MILDALLKVELLRIDLVGIELLRSEIWGIELMFLVELAAFLCTALYLRRLLTRYPEILSGKVVSGEILDTGRMTDQDEGGPATDCVVGARHSVVGTRHGVV